MTNKSSIQVLRLPSGYFAYYSAAWKTGLEAVLDKSGKPKPFPSQIQAENAAYKALLAVENKTYALRNDPEQARVTPKFYELRSRAGKKAFAERKLREAMKEVVK